MGGLRARGSRSRRVSRSGGLWLLVAGVACGRADAGHDEPPAGAGGETALAGNGGASAGSGGTTAPGVGGQSGQGSVEEPGAEAIFTGENVALGDEPRTDLLAIGALEILEARCGNCHSGDQDAGGIGDVTDVVALIARGTIVPGAGEDSPLIESVRSGRMPPSANRGPTRGELLVLINFINGLSTVPPQSSCEPFARVSYDDVYVALAADIAKQPAENRPFIRYLGLQYASNARYCGPLIVEQRHALFKAINSVSTGSDVVVPVPIQETELLYRIDLRDYGWDRPIDLEDDGTVDHRDGWQAIVAAAAPYGVEFTGPDADVVKTLAATSMPVLPVNAFVHATQAGDVYYALTGARENTEQTRLDLGIDLIALSEAGALSRAAFSGSGPDGSWDAIVDRIEQVNRPGRHYWLMSVFTVVRGSSIYDDPLDLRRDFGQSIFNLPNGLQAYAIETAEGQRVGRVPEGCDDCERPQRVNAAGCHSCHAAGIIPVEDRMRPYVEEYSASFDSQTIADVRATYLTQPELDALIATASEMHQAALERAGVPREQPDRVSSVYAGFELDVDLEHVSAELMVTPELLQAGIQIGDPALVPFALGTSIRRAAFSEAYRRLLCSYSVGNNRPLTCQ
jgi:hypothetical protein